MADPERTAEQLAQMRAETEEQLRSYGYTDIVFTCSTCVYAPTCEYAYDGYNTNGDCLQDK